jgi:hypothetical protein
VVQQVLVPVLSRAPARAPCTNADTLALYYAQHAQGNEGCWTALRAGHSASDPVEGRQPARSWPFESLAVGSPSAHAQPYKQGARSAASGRGRSRNTPNISPRAKASAVGLIATGVPPKLDGLFSGLQHSGRRLTSGQRERDNGGWSRPSRTFGADACSQCRGGTAAVFGTRAGCCRLQPRPSWSWIAPMAGS